MAAIAAPEGPDWLRVSLFVPLVALCVAAWNWRRGRWGLGQLRASRLWPALPWMLVLAVATPWIAERALHWVLALWSLPWLLWAILPRGVASRRSSLARLVQFLGSFAALGLAAWLTDGWAIAAGGLTGGPGAWVWDWPLFASPRSWGCLLVLWLTSRWPLTAGGVPPGRLLRHVHLSLEEASTEGIRWHRLQRVAGVGEAGSAWAIVMIFGCGPLLPFELLGFFQRAALPMGVSLTGCVLLKTLVVWALMQIAPRLSLPNMHMGMWVGALIAATLALLVLVAPHRPDITLTLSGLVGITLGLVWRAWLDRQHIGVGTESSGFSPFLGAPKRG